MAHRVCPWWVGYFLASPVRKLYQNPKAILAPYVREGTATLDIGCAMGFFSLPLAEMVGPRGRVVCVDMQERMLAGLRRRAGKAGLLDRIETRLCHKDSLCLNGLEGKIDFALAFAVLHEVPGASAFFRGVHGALSRHGKLLLAEPRGHVTEKAFAVSTSLAERIGFKIVDRPHIRLSRAAVMEKV